jgi:hypothetical protein
MAKATRKKTPSELAAEPNPRAELDASAFLKAAGPVLAELKSSLAERAAASPAVHQALEARHAAEKAARRTADSFLEWRERFVEQVAAAWLLSCVFVRTLEDRGLLGHARIAGEGALDSQKLFFELAPSLSERDYLFTVFRELSRFAAAAALFDGRHNPIWLLAPSAEAAKSLLALFRTPEATAPAFRFGQPDTRFLGDLYQDLDEGVRKRFALLQTPRFVESFILDRTLERALERFGLDDTTLIDPTCGSGHFLLGAFERLFRHRLAAEPGLDQREAARRALNGVYGADINPYAVAIARFRLTLAFLDAAGYKRLADAPALPLHLAVADSLLHNPQLPQGTFAMVDGQSAAEWSGQEYALEDEKAARDVLHRRYAAVVGNPPYITVKDEVLRERYREMYSTAFRSYSVAVPFTERFFQLAREGGSVGMITANSFMKREFGKKVIEEFFPSANLDLVVNTSGAYIPGHGTPTVLLFGTAEPPKGTDVLTVLAKRGEPTTPENAERGLAWRSIAEHFGEVGFDNEYISVARVERSTFAKHPWSLGGGGAAELKDLLEERADKRLSGLVHAIGRSTHTGEDSIFFMDVATALRLGFRAEAFVHLGKGEQVRDWAITEDEVCLFPYDRHTAEAQEPSEPRERQHYWRYRAVLKDRQDFGQKIEARGLKWFEHSMFFPERYRNPLSIAFAFVATHNHFVLDRGGKVFKQSAPIIKLPEGATEDDHLALLAYLNSSTACFFFRQAGHCKGAQGVNEGHKSEEWEQFLEFSGTLVGSTPIPPLGSPNDKATSAGQLRAVAVAMNELARRRDACSPRAVLERWNGEESLPPLLVANQRFEQSALARMCGLQEELDWLVYEAFGLLEPNEVEALRRIRGVALADFPLHIDQGPDSVGRAGLRPGHRAFEMELAGRSLRSGTHTAWFARNGYASPAEASNVYARPYQELLEARIELLRANARIRVMEQPECKHRWTVINWDAEVKAAATETLLSSLELAWQALVVTSTACDLGRALDTQRLRQVAALLEDEPVTAETAKQLVKDAAVPFVSSLRLTPPGLAKRAAWEHTWSLQRREDAGEAVGDIPVPPKYDQKDFRDPIYWRLRGKLDVPKERFISYPGCESDEDHEPVYGWAGWNHLEQAQALSALYQDRKTREGWDKERLTPMLAGLLELIPWVKQWHNEPSAEFGGLKLGDYFEAFLAGECSALGLTEKALRDWRPADKKAGRGRKKAKAVDAPAESPKDEEEP